MTLEEFFSHCQKHDFFYRMSDDFSYYKAGSDRESILLAAMRRNPEYRAIYDAWRDYRHCKRAAPPTLAEFMERAA